MCIDCSNTINTLPTGSSGLDGDSSYIYVATATDSSGTDFALYEDEPTQCWKAIKTSTTPISPINASVFDGLWFDTCGTNGNNGTNGTNGREGVDGTVWTTDTGNPTSGSANNGDYYINETNGQVWLYDEGWIYQGFSLKGANGNNGANGADGNIWINGSGDPRGEVTGTTIGDLYLDNTTGDVYSWDGSQWNIVTTIMGPKGDTGDTGATGPAGDPQTITSVDDSITITEPSTNTYNLSVNYADSWKYIPFDDSNYPFDGSDTGTNGRYTLEPDWATMTGTYTLGADARTFYMYAYNATGGFTASTANSARLQYKKNKDNTIHVKGILRSVVKTNNSGTLNFQALSTGVTVSGTTTENGTLQGTTIDNSLIWMYPMVGLNLSDITKAGFIPCTILIDTETSASLNNYNLASSTKVGQVEGLFYFSKNSLRLYSAAVINGSSTISVTGGGGGSITIPGVLTANTEYTMTIFINGLAT